jgi:hypothetical protein
MGLVADPVASLPLFDRSCALDFAEACEIAAGLRAEGLGP